MRVGITAVPWSAMAPLRLHAVDRRVNENQGLGGLGSLRSLHRRKATTPCIFDVYKYLRLV